MRNGPDISEVAALIGDPGRAHMLLALLDGRALSAGELAGEAGVTLQTASGDFPIVDGMVRAPQAPGLGITPDLSVMGDPVASYK